MLKLLEVLTRLWADLEMYRAARRITKQLRNK